MAIKSVRTIEIYENARAPLAPNTVFGGATAGQKRIPIAAPDCEESLVDGAMDQNTHAIPMILRVAMFDLSFNSPAAHAQYDRGSRLDVARGFYAKTAERNITQHHLFRHFVRWHFRLSMTPSGTL